MIWPGFTGVLRISSGQPRIAAWILHLITERKLSASSINLAINALRAFYGGLLGQDIKPYFVGINRPTR